MKYLQHKSKQKLHLVFELEDGLTHPVCGKKYDSYRASFNMPLGNACKNCLKRINSLNFDRNKFIREYYQ